MYNKIPKLVANIPLSCQEHFSYIYLPIKFPGQVKPTLEPRIECLNFIIGRACSDFIGEYGLDAYMGQYIYLTAKNQYQANGPFNRPGWHSDGFRTNDIQYIWSNKQPTIFNKSEFNLSDDDSISMIEMQEQALPENDYTFSNFDLLRIDQYSIHRVADFEIGVRFFIKISFSKDIYALQGNSINYGLNYKWEYTPRSTERNMPQTIAS